MKIFKPTLNTFKADKISEAVKESLMEFGRYQFYDKGAWEVIYHFDEYVNIVARASLEDLENKIVPELVKLTDKNKDCKQFVSYLISGLEGSSEITEEAWDILLQDECLEELL